MYQCLPQEPLKTFGDYTNTIFMPYIRRQLEHVNRLDIVWDAYDPNSLKANTREKRGTGIRRRVEAASNVPSNWQSFLRVNENKAELFHMLAEEVTNIHFPGKEV